VEVQSSDTYLDLPVYNTTFYRGKLLVTAGRKATGLNLE